nr:transcription factor IIIA-like [Tanacetum cinerariifolium]
MRELRGKEWYSPRESEIDDREKRAVMILSKSLSMKADENEKASDAFLGNGFLEDRVLANHESSSKQGGSGELRMMRWTCGKTMVDMIPNGVFRAALDVDSIIDKMRERRLRWFGHVKRRPQTAPVRRVEATVVEGLRRRRVAYALFACLVFASFAYALFSFSIPDHLPYAHVHWPECAVDLRYYEHGLLQRENSNLRVHVKVAHFQDIPIICSLSERGMRFAYKHVTDNHEKTGRHVYKVVDFVDADVEFQSRPRGILSISLLQVHHLGWFTALKRSGSHGLLHLKSTGHTGRCTQIARVRRMKVGEFANFSIW